MELTHELHRTCVLEKTNTLAEQTRGAHTAVSCVPACERLCVKVNTLRGSSHSCEVVERVRGWFVVVVMCYWSFLSF